MKSKRLDRAYRGDSRKTFLLGRFGYVALFGAGALALAACNTSVGAGSTGTGAAGGEGGNGGAGAAGGAGGNGGAGGGEIGKVSKVDILVSVDNSRSMADKQQILALALDDLLSGLANPPCLDANGQIIGAGPQDVCPAGSSRQYQPVTDIHIGIVSSSLGGHGSDACEASGVGKASNNDMGHLLSRIDPTSAAMVPTYENKGFLAWDPTQQMTPPGESNPIALAQHFSDMVLGVGQIGCGYESQLESVYRFLVDPAPYESIGLDGNGQIQKNGVDSALLEQRKAFLRSDSMLVVLSLSDENDCSIRENGQYYLAAQQKGSGGTAFHLPAARAICATDPNDQCCYSCGQVGPKDANGDPLCAPDASCQDAGGAVKYLDEVSDNIGLRCFDQKRRFGIDFLYPVERYVEAFTSPTIVDQSGQLVANPVFSDLDASDGVTLIRDPGLVVLAGIVGVPWQDIAKNPNDLKQGVKSAAELSQANASGQTTWDVILGNPGNNVAPLDPFMLEATSARNGVNPVTGTATTAPGGAPNAINGSERTIMKQDDLQYACIMPIPTARDCSQLGDPNFSCDCGDPNNDSPLCETDPTTGGATLQTRAKAYPGRRQLAVLEGLGNQAVVGSICAAQITDPAQGDYAYRPVVASLLDRVKTRLQ